MELWKKCRIGILFLAMLCLITGCSPVDWKTAADTITEQASKEIKKPEEVEKGLPFDRMLYIARREFEKSL